MAPRKQPEAQAAPDPAVAQVEAAGNRRLDLDAAAEAHSLRRDEYKVNGTWYQMRTPDDFSMADKETLRVLMLRLRDIAESALAEDALPRDERDALMARIETELVCLVLIGFPASEASTVDPYIRHRVVDAFRSDLRDVLVPIVLQVYEDLMSPLRPMLRQIAAARGNEPTTGATPPATSAATGSSRSTSSSATAAG